MAHHQEQEQRALTIRLVREHCLTPEQQQLPPEEIADLLLEHSALDLHHAGITAIHELYAFSHIQSLSLSHNCISDMSPVAALVNCKIIRLDHNRIQQIRGVEMLYKLIELDVQHNAIMVPEEGLRLPPQLRKLCLVGNPLFPRSNNADDDDEKSEQCAHQLAELEQAVCARCPNIHIHVYAAARPESARPGTASNKERSLRDSLLAKVSSHSQLPLPQPAPTSPSSPAAVAAEKEMTQENESTAAEIESSAFDYAGLDQYRQEMDRVGDEELRAFREHRLQAKKATAEAQAASETEQSVAGGGGGGTSEWILKAREYLQLRREQLRREVEEYEQATKLRMDSWQQQRAERMQRSEIENSGLSDGVRVQENT